MLVRALALIDQPFVRLLRQEGKHACLPLARVVSLGRRTGRVDAAAWHRRVDEAERQLARA